MQCTLLIEKWFLTSRNVSFDPLRAKISIWNIKMYLQFVSLLHTDRAQEVEILSLVRQELAYST